LKVFRKNNAKIKKLKEENQWYKKTLHELVSKSSKHVQMLMDKDDEIFRLEELQCGKLIENLKYESMRSKWLIEMDAEIA
jgi:hypothetical protein